MSNTLTPNSLKVLLLHGQKAQEAAQGKKFAPVEFVATTAAVFRNFSGEPVQNVRETPAAARKRVLDVVKDSNIELLLQMRNPDSVSVMWSRRY